MRISDAEIRGRTVIAADGRVIGEVASVSFESEGWRVESFQLRLRKETADQLGAHRSVFQAGELEVPVRMVQSVGETVVLSVAMSGLQSVLPNDGSEASSST
jgi:sporulation protein YlmC with PRC-barrel domain